MTADLKNVRFQMMMSEAEAEAIDAWASENKLRSKAEAMRRLCDIGMSAATKADSLELERLRLQSVKRKAARRITGLKKRISDSPDDAERLKLLYRGLDALTDIVGELVECSSDIATISLRMTGPAVANRSQEEIEAAIYQSGWTPSDAETESDEELRARLTAVKNLVDRGKQPDDS
ncbi:hypothetical protein [Rhizobium grahamii]|uniref:Uncharacterized protein n=1 Tax=Rhizobium grahamii TaxID=1120045 RepID=A0A370KRM9_9HYPH|nr:hypothetical protein [Rhizobium grahamii]RDJ12437.1 hypothetical protein B5K06_11935 [Rhizobium grahamii]